MTISQPVQPLPATTDRERAQKALRYISRHALQIAGGLFLVALVVAAIHNLNVGIARPHTLLQNLFFGLSSGSIYALIALGYTLVYGILFMINFAHGEVFMAGGYIGYFAIVFANDRGWLEQHTIFALFLTITIAAIFSITIAVLLERVAYRPLRAAPRLVPLITAIGTSIALQQLFLRLFGADSRRYPNVHYYIEVPGCSVCKELPNGAIGLDLVGGIYQVSLLGQNIRLRPIWFIVLFLACSLMIALWFYIQRTKRGKAMRAVAEDKHTAALMGIDVDGIIVTTFVLGAALAGAAAVLFLIIPGNGQATPFIGFLPGIKAFTAAVLGGIGNIPGAALGGLFLGVVEAVGPTLWNIDHQLKEIVVFGLLILVLILRPTGIFGEILSKRA